MKQRFIIGGAGAVLAATWLTTVYVTAQGAQGRQGIRAVRGDAAETRTVIRDLGGDRVPTRGRGEALPAGFNPNTGNFDNVLRSRTTDPVDFERDAGIRQRMFQGKGDPGSSQSALGRRAVQ